MDWRDQEIGLGIKRCPVRPVDRYAAVFRLRESGMTYRAIGEQLGISQQRVGQIMARMKSKS